MKFILIALTMLPLIANAHCPIALDIKSEKYCTEIEWQKGDLKSKGQFVESDVLSPYLIPMGEIPQKWIYSKAQFAIWKDGDANHLPQEIPGLRIFPYMLMTDGHHHGASYEFNYDQNLQQYVLKAVGLQSMPGCWQLRWTTENTDDFTASAFLANIVTYSNLDESKNLEMAEVCADDNVVADENHHH